MDESGCFFKASPSKGLAQIGTKCKGGKKSKQRMAVSFCGCAEGGKVDKPKVIWKIKKKSCFKRINAASKRKQVSYFADAKLWMQADIIGKVLEQINYIMKRENRNVLLFLNNAQVHPENLVGKCSNIKI